MGGHGARMVDVSRAILELKEKEVGCEISLWISEVVRGVWDVGCIAEIKHFQQNLEDTTYGHGDKGQSQTNNLVLTK